MKTKKLIQYSALASGFLAAGNNADAQIIYTDIVPDTILLPPHEDYLLDFNGDGSNDLKFHLHNGISVPDYSYQDDIWIDALAESFVWIKQPFNSGEMISSDAGDWQTLSHRYMIYLWWNIVSCEINTIYYDNWLETENKFIPLQFGSAGENYFGWVRVSIPNNYEDCETLKLIIHDYAYEAEAGMPIIAGDMGSTISCEPPIVTSSIIQPTAVKLFWDAIDGASAYKIKYRESGTTAWASANTNLTHKKILGLDCNTTYEYKMYSICADGTDTVFSAASPIATVTTASCRISDTNTDDEILINIYPNPAQNILFTNVTGFISDKLKVDICNIFGENVKTIIIENTDELQFDISDLPNGIYTINISDNEKSVSEKFVKQ
ncbi:MAG: T9SS type A sorting domain-containing protein [Fimbriimonadaceae bacterium]|nr:T9SS type A sorting domain-containing protein [Chitinophagales bacterium]